MRSIEEGWKLYERTVAMLIQQLMVELQGLGVHIVEDASLRRLRGAFEENPRVVVLLAHWKGPVWFDRDLILDPLPPLRVRLAASSEPIAHQLLDFLDQRWSTSGIAVTDRKLAQAFNDFSSQHPDLDREDVRDMLDTVLDGLVVPGNVLELRDGFHSAASVGASVPDHWTGVVDLGVCHSLRLALSIKQNRHDRWLVTNEKSKNFIRLIPEIIELFLRLSLQKNAYIALRQNIHRMYAQFHDEG